MASAATDPVPVARDRRLRRFRAAGNAGRRAVCAGLLGWVLWAASVAGAQALELKCVEPSRYKNLLQAFNDNPSTLSSYFGLDRTQLPDMNACRALAVTGSLRAGDAAALIDEVIRGQGWLAVLYLSFDGVDVEEEVKLAQVIRAFWLKTRVARSPMSRYAPDFASRWGPPAVASAGEEPTATPAELSPLNKGLDAFARRSDLALPIPASRDICIEGCIGAWSAGVHRRLTPLPPIMPKPYPGDGIPDMVTGPVRAALLASLDAGKPPRPGDPILRKRVIVGELPVMPPAAERLLRERCAAEIIAGEALEERVGAAMDELARNQFRALHDNPLPILSQYDSLRAAGVRLQRCVAGAYEKERLASFHRLCGPGCGKSQLVASFERTGREFVDQYLGFADLFGPAPSDPIGRLWQEEEPGGRGTWTARGASDVFDATWTRSDGRQELATVEIGRAGNRVTVLRTQDQGRCLYQGTVAADGRTASGTYTCFWVPGVYAWQAVINE